MTEKPRCPKCKATTGLMVERRPNGDANCTICGWRGAYTECFEKLECTPDVRHEILYGDVPYGTRVNREETKVYPKTIESMTLSEIKDAYVKLVIKRFFPRSNLGN